MQVEAFANSAFSHKMFIFISADMLNSQASIYIC